MNLIKDVNLLLCYKNETITIPIDFEVLRRKSIYFETIIKHDIYTVKYTNNTINTITKNEITIILDHFDIDDVLNVTKQLIEHKQSEESLLNVNTTNILQLLQICDYFQFYDLDYLLSKLEFNTILDIDCNKKVWYAAHLIQNSSNNIIFEDILKLYLEHNIGILNSQVDKYGMLLIFAIRIDASKNIIKILIDLGVDVDLKYAKSWTTLMFASRYTRTRKNAVKIPVCVDTNLQNNNKTDDVEDIVKMIIDSGANVDLQNDTGWSALMLSSGNSNNDSTENTVKMLIDAGANLNLKNVSGYTALMISSIYSKNDSTEKTVKMLIDAGANVNLQNDKGWTALMLSIDNNNMENNSTENTVKLLIDAGSDLTLRNDNGDTAMIIAKKRKYDNIISMIKKKT